MEPRLVCVNQAPGALVDPERMSKKTTQPGDGRYGAGADRGPDPIRAEDLKGQDRIDYDLMQRVATNQPSSMDDLYDRFGSLVFRMAIQSLPTREEAEDAVQEIFVRLWKTAERYDPRKAALVTWVMLLTRRHLVDKLRRKRARIKTTIYQEDGAGGDSGRIESDVSTKIQRDEHFAALMTKVNKLPELQRTVVVRAYLGGQTLRQISEELGVPLGTIKSALSRALVRLRERVGEEVTP